MTVIRVVRNLNKSLYHRIMALPDDIKTKIYKEYLEPVIKQKHIQCILRKCNSISSDISHQNLLAKMIKYALNNEYVLNYLLKTCEDFNTTYALYLNDRLLFKLVTDKYDKFALNWLALLFH
jgi:hypothetical protein